MIAPLYCSQKTSLAVLGIEGRRFREMVIRHRIRHARDEHLVIVRLDDWHTAMDRLSVEGQTTDAANDGADPVMSVDDFLAVAGKRRAGGQGR